MKEVMVSKLKARLSAYLSAVQAGETVIVRSRQIPIAKLVPYAGPESLQLRPAGASPRGLRGIKPVELVKKVDVLAMLRNDRDSR